MEKCMFCGAFTTEGICKTCKWKMEVDQQEERENQKIRKRKIKEKKQRGGVK